MHWEWTMKQSVKSGSNKCGDEAESFVYQLVATRTLQPGPKTYFGSGNPDEYGCIVLLNPETLCSTIRDNPELIC